MPIGPWHVFSEEMSSSVFCPYFDHSFDVVVTELYELFLYFGNESLVGHMVCKYLVLVLRLCFLFCVWFPVQNHIYSKVYFFYSQLFYFSTMKERKTYY